MKRECQDLISEMIIKYSEYLEEEKIDSSSFLIEVLAAQLVEARKQIRYLRTYIRCMNGE